MRRRSIRFLLAALLVSTLAACDEDGVLDPGSGAENTELSASVDLDLAEAMVSDVEAMFDAASGVAPSPSGYTAPAQSSVPGDIDPELEAKGRALLEEAREFFRRAYEAWQRGDTELAAELAEQGRLKVAEAIYCVFGEEGIARLKERVDLIISWLEERVDEEQSDLLDRIRELRQEAQDYCDQEQFVEAGERLILAIVIAGRERRDHRRDDLAAHARFSIFMAYSSLQLAVEVVGDDPTEDQAYLLRYAQHLLGHAEEAFGLGRYAIALHQAREVIGLTLLAVLQEPGTDRDKVQWMIELSERAIAEMQAAIEGRDLGAFAAALAEHAVQLQRRGVELAETNPREAIHVLWFASVMANGVIQLVDEA